MIDLTTLHKNNNFRNSQNYVFKIEKNKSDKNLFLFKNQLIEMINNEFKEYSTSSGIRLFFYKILFFFGIYKFNFDKIRGIFWKIEDVFIFNIKSLNKELHKFGISDITNLIFLDKDNIRNNYLGVEGSSSIIGENFLYKISYYKTMNLEIFLNHIQKTEISKNDFELLKNNKNNYIKLFLKILFIYFIVYLTSYFLNNFILSSNENTGIIIISSIFLLFSFLFSGSIYGMLNVNVEKSK